MTVVFDLLGFQNREHGERGIARYVQNLALAFERVDSTFVDHYLVHDHLPIPQGIEPLISSGKLIRSDQLESIVDVASGGLFIAGSVFELQEPLETVLPIWARRPEWRTAAVLYDLIPLRFPDWYLTNPVIRFEYKARVAAIRRFDHLLSISEASGRDAQELLGVGPERITTIWAGADAQFRPPLVTHGEVAEQLATRITGLRPSYLLFPSGIERRKNIDRLLEAYAGLPPTLRQRHQLVLVCRTNDDERVALDETAKELGIEQDLLVTGFVSDGDLVALYQGAELVVFPAIYEGFGLPVLEAMRCGAPVICSDSSSLVEVQPDPRARFDPASTTAIRDALTAALGDEAERQRLREIQPPDFSWERSAQCSIDGLDALAAARPGLNRRPTLALVTPLPGQRSGIATYARRLLRHLSEQFDITVFLEGEIGDVEPIDGIGLQPLRLLPQLQKSGGHFDHVLYFIGNSSFHVDALAMLELVPGDVLLHDVRLSGLYSEVLRLEPERLPHASMGWTLETMYPERYRRSVIASPDLWPETAARFGILMVADVARMAKRLFVHSDYAAALVELDCGRRPEHLFDIPCPAVPAEQAVDRSGPPIIASFGIISPIKQPADLLRATADLLPDHPGLRLVLAGGVDGPYQQVLLDLARDLGIADSVSIPGHLSNAEFSALQSEATLAVQLRSNTNGESSAAISETLAMGLPTVVSRLGSMAELPDTVVAHVDPDDGYDGLLAELRSLLDDPDRCAALRRSARSYATEHSFEAAACLLTERLIRRASDPRALTPAD